MGVGTPSFSHVFQLTMDGQRIAHYQIQSRLGGGGIGEVWKAYDPKLQRTVAIKVVHETHEMDDAAGRILAGPEIPIRMIVVEDWFEELKARAPAARGSS